jgi:lambda repressor-like predicted transcriptional regulator
MVHQGDVIERIIRRQGHSLTDLARLTGVNRRSIYNWFLQPRVRPENIIRIGQAIHHDFSAQFPDQFVSEDFLPVDDQAKIVDDKIDVWKEKYVDLLERYNLLLRIATGELQLPVEASTSSKQVNDEGFLV